MCKDAFVSPSSLFDSSHDRSSFRKKTGRNSADDRSSSQSIECCWFEGMTFSRLFLSLAQFSSLSQLKQYEVYLAKLTDNLEKMSERLIKLEAWIPFMVCLLLFLLIWCLWSTYVLIRLRHRLRSVKSRSTKKSGKTSSFFLKSSNHIELVVIADSIDDEEEDENGEAEEEDRPVFCNGRTKRKFSTDSNDSNQSRSQRVPDSTSLPKIRENGHRNHHSSRHNRAHRRKGSQQDPSASTTTKHWSNME